MSDEILNTVMTGLAAGVGKELVAKSWPLGKKWIDSFFKDHNPKAVEKGIANSQDFLDQLAVKVYQLEEQQQVDRAVIDRAIEELSFGLILQKALIGSAQTESPEKHGLLAELVAMKLNAAEETVRSVVAPLACDAITHVTHNQLKILGIQAALTVIHPSFDQGSFKTGHLLGYCNAWLSARLDPFTDTQARRIDLLHLESLSCVAILELAEYPLANKLEFWKCDGFQFTVDLLYQLPIGEKDRAWWETQGLNQVKLTEYLVSLLAYACFRLWAGYPWTLQNGVKIDLSPAAYLPKTQSPWRAPWREVCLQSFARRDVSFGLPGGQRYYRLH